MTPVRSVAPALYGLQRLPGPAAVFVGPGAATRLAGVLAELEARRVLVVRGGASYFRSGAERVVAALSPGHEIAHLAGVRPNPDVAQVVAGVEVARRFGPDAVVGIGGGSVMDVAKAVAVLTAQQHGAPACLQSPGLVREPRRCALVLVPTASGSGTEATRFATVYVGLVKHSLEDDGARPDVALVDPDLTATVPMPVAVSGGLDALSQATESYWAVAATEASRVVARRALETLVFAWHETVRRSTWSDRGLRAELSWGSALAGAAIDQTRTTAAHALSYPLTARLGVPHGVAVALHLRWLVAHNQAATTGDCRHPDGPGGLRRLIEDIQHVARHIAGTDIEDLAGRLLALGGYAVDLRDLVSPVADWTDPFDAALVSGRAENNPRLVTESDVRGALTSTKRVRSR